MGELAKIASGIYLEGLAVDHGRDVIWYSDVISGGIYGAKTPRNEVCSFNEDKLWTGGIMMNADGTVFSSGEGEVMWYDPDSGESGWLIDKIGGEPINGINEMVPDGTGGFYFGTNDIVMVIRGSQSRPTELYRLTADCELTKLADCCDTLKERRQEHAGKFLFVQGTVRNPRTQAQARPLQAYLKRR